MAPSFYRWGYLHQSPSLEVIQEPSGTFSSLDLNLMYSTASFGILTQRFTLFPFFRPLPALAPPLLLFLLSISILLEVLLILFYNLKCQVVQYDSNRCVLVCVTEWLIQHESTNLGVIDYLISTAEQGNGISLV